MIRSSHLAAGVRTESRLITRARVIRKVSRTYPHPVEVFVGLGPAGAGCPFAARLVDLRTATVAARPNRVDLAQDYRRRLLAA
jgi:hypothetical protein